MPLKRQLVYGDRDDPAGVVFGGVGSGGGQGSGSTRTTILRHPEGPFIPHGRGIGGWEPLPHPTVDRRDIGTRALPPLPPQIITPFPVIEKKKTPSILDVINEIIFPKKQPAEVEPVSHIFGIPHSLSEIGEGIIGIGKEIIAKKIFGVAAPLAIPTQLGFYEGYSPLDSSLEIFEEGWTAAKQLNFFGPTGAPPVAEHQVGTFLGCPVEEDDGCEPAKKRYTITIDSRTGQCIKIKRTKSRKRRRRLASLSDIKDIAALKQVLGGGKTLDTWIATRGR